MFSEQTISTTVSHSTVDFPGNPVTNRKIQEYHLAILENLGEKFSLLEHLAKISITPMNQSLMDKRISRIRTRLVDFHRLRKQVDSEEAFLTEEVKRLTGGL